MNFVFAQNMDMSYPFFTVNIVIKLQSLLDLDLDHIVATSLRILTATVLDSDEMLGPLEEKLCPQKLSVEFLPYGFASAQKMFFFTEWPCHAHESNWS